MGKRWVMGGVAAVVAVALIAGVAIGRNADKPKGKPDVTLEFTQREVVRPAMASLPVTIAFSGPLVAPQTAAARAKAGGTLLALHVAEGSRVKAGQVIGKIDLSELSSRLNERNAMLESARTQLAQAERTHASNQKLSDQKFISPIALENSRAALETARAQVSAATAQLNTLQATWRDAALLAPISGVVAKRHAVPGEKLTAEQPVVTIVDLARLELAGSVGTHEVSLLEPGMPVEVQVEGVAKPVAARLARIAPSAEAGTRSIGVTVELANPDELYRAGQYALARVVLPDNQQRLTLPASAIGSVAGQEHVWVIENGQLARRAVTTGRRDDATGRVELLNGVPQGAQVLAARFDNLREGTKAAVVAKAAPVASGAASSTLQ
jgi:membrane fusion protein (multidrug efflux system)